MGEPATPTTASTGSATNYALLTLSQLRDKAKITANPNDYSSRSWIQNAQNTAEQAKQDEDHGLNEKAFVGYLKACQFFQAFLQHKDYPKIKAEGSKNVSWQPYMAFSQKRADYLSKARTLSEELKNRAVERQNGSVSTHTSSGPANPKEQPKTPSTQPTTDEPDVSAGGSIAARLAALKGAGMQVGVAKRTSKDLGLLQSPNANTSTQPSPTAPQSASSTNTPNTPSQYVTANGETPVSATYSGGFSANGASESRRTSVASITHQLNPGSSNQPVYSTSSGSRRGSVASVNTTQSSTAGINSQTTGGSNPASTPKVEYSSYLDSNKTGSSLNSSRSFDRHSQNQSLPSPRLGSLPMNGASQAGYGVGSGNGKSSTAIGPASRTLPSVPNHQHRPPQSHTSNPYDSASNTPSSYPGFVPGTSRSRQNTINGGYNAGTKPEVIQEDDELAHFSTAFPPLSDFEGKPEFTEPTLLPIDGLRIPDNHPQNASPKDGDQGNAEEDVSVASLFPSAPKSRPGDILEKSSGALHSIPDINLNDASPGHGESFMRAEPNNAHSPSGVLSGLTVTDPVQRPSSLPMPDTTRTDESYFPSSPGSSGPPSTSKEHPLKSPALLPSSLPSSAGLVPRSKPPLPPIPNAKPKSLSAQKPTLPLTNSISSEVLYDYLQEPSLSLLVIDTRPYDEHQQDYIGKDMNLADGRRVNTIWIDPTILAFPKTGSRPTAPGILFSIIFENEFRKSLPRSPVLLIGGFHAWKEEVELRRKGERNARDASAGYKAVIKGPPPVVSTKRTSQSLPTENNDSPDSRAVRRETGVYRSSGYSRNITDNFNAPYPQSMAGLGQGYNGQPMIPNSMVSATSRSSQPSAYSTSAYASAGPTPPPLASTSPGPLSRKRSDYVDQHNQAYSGYQNHTSRPSIDYPQIGVSSIPQPPPAAATSSSERQESRPRADRSASIISFDGLSRLPESDDMMYWNDVALGISGLKNLGNTCYMNSTLQCLSATYPLARFFRDGSFKRAINTVNPMGTKGDLAKAFATLISVLWNEQYTFLSPVTFRKSISTYAPSFAGTDQHDSQEFLSFLLDGLHEDLNRIRTKPPPVEMSPEREAALESLPPSVAAEKEWQIYKQRNDSLIVDLFQGQYRNRMECLTCHKVRQMIWLQSNYDLIASSPI
ncbi:hypothetical protein QFC19_006807 [Naganishia cerealis]|uniref:Uncharacterized protein n=1 Tax=Naganishia cerealis TaxID=610337 RepID=A0ACC2VES1_9TREE|nr:hypothetical protein QFC19_006807 [Naganishia cerealis]